MPYAKKFKNFLYSALTIQEKTADDEELFLKNKE
jgi:hypothetical protein